MELLHQRPHPQAMADDLVDLSTKNVLQYYQYEDEAQILVTFPVLDEKSEVTLEWGG